MLYLSLCWWLIQAGAHLCNVPRPVGRLTDALCLLLIHSMFCWCVCVLFNALFGFLGLFLLYFLCKGSVCFMRRVISFVWFKVLFLFCVVTFILCFCQSLCPDFVMFLVIQFFRVIKFFGFVSYISVDVFFLSPIMFILYFFVSMKNKYPCFFLFQYYFAWSFTDLEISKTDSK